MFIIPITLLSAAAIIAVALKLSFRIVPAHHTAIFQRWGKFERIVGPGAYLLVPGRDSFRRVTWSYPEETTGNNRAPRDDTVRPIVRRFVRTDMFYMGDQRMDVVPCEGVTSDSVTVTINGTLNYRINDAQHAAYRVNDPLAFMVDSVFAAVRKVVAERTHLDMIGADVAIADAIMEHVNERMQEYGVTCTQFLVQGIDMDNEIKRSYERAIVAERSRETELASHQAEVEFKKRLYPA
jgi:regulator of protease activity HflC (stomatin/prohibitin superfamily)